MVRFLQTSDWQLGMTRHFLEGEAQARYTAARIDAVRALGEVARAEHCDFVVVAGDVFESNLVSTRTIARSLEAMGSIGCPVYLLPGNHDTLDAASVYTSAAFRRACPPGVVVLDRAGIHRVATGVEIVAAPWFHKPALTDLAAQVLREVDDPEPGVTRILLAHGPIDVLSPDEDDPARISLAGLEEALAAGHIHHVALGDRHSRLSVGRSGRIHYSGSPEVTAFRDDIPGDVLVVDVDTEMHAARPHHVGTWTFTTMRRHLDTADDLDALDAEFAAIDPKDRTVVRTAFVGTLSLADKARLDDLLERWDESLAARFTWTGHDDVAVYVDGDELADLGVGGFVDDAVAELLERARGGEGEPAARDALALLYRLGAAR
ncbi:metallophosphoesterase family protein [Mobilicoccus pelagius]|uniref:Nuclease SbcCD subunit D n=1 Tax=Mobilicoccus pelagius NBRC 104925 TaxID=1089455 RepID=H5UTB9_9MICO|nr:metallophosphoesterase [Mobilicoccus pelagius]GAB48977.1 putative exonuclease [Mobilicoccus pelagius NBRC 104925]